MKKKKKYYFISDAHLGAKKNDEIKIRKLMSFLQHINEPNNTLFIVGDLFDFWFEYTQVIPYKHFPILCMLHIMVENGVEINFIPGNHDFWIGNFFENMGIKIYKDPIDTWIENKHYYIDHGDGLLKADRGYRILKKILRNSLSIKLYRLIHPDIGIALAHFFSNLSRNKKIEHNQKEYINFAKNKFKQGFDNVILGHTHLPFEFKEKDKIFINIGDWIDHFTYGYLEDNQLKLKYWNIS